MKKYIISILFITLVLLQYSCTDRSGGGEDIPEIQGGDVSSEERISTVSLTPSQNQITLSLTSTTSESSAHNIYWALTEDVSTQNNVRTITSVNLPYVHTDLSEDKEYFYIVSELKENGDEHFYTMVSSKASPIRNFPDPNLKAAILEQIGKTDGQAL